jgi:cell division ATPase FtsA
MTPLILITILDKITGALVVIPTVLEVAQKIKALLSVDGSDFEVQLQAIKDGAVVDADETLRIINEWRAAHPE